MNSKNVTLLILVISVFVPLAAFILMRSYTRENVYQATENYASSGHADTESRAFTHWDTSSPAVVPATCAACHSTSGFLEYLGEDGSRVGAVFQAVPVGEVITCSACHNISAHNLEQVLFRSGYRHQPSGSEAACLICHQALESGTRVQLSLLSVDEDSVSAEIGFINPHYSYAASSQFGSTAGSGYEYPDREYAGYFGHAYGAETCSDCHNPHSLEVDPQLCAACHSNVVSQADFEGIRLQRLDFDGDGDNQEGIRAEIEGLQEHLLAALWDYASAVSGKGILWADRFPYFFIDSNQNGQAEEEELTPANRFDAWTPRLVKAAYNYQFSKKDAGGYVHNARYILQLLHDSLQDLNSVTGRQAEGVLRP